MAQIDDEQLQLTLGIVGVGTAPIDLLVHQGAKMGLDREILEAVPVVRFGLRGQVLERDIVVVFSALPLDIVQADAVIAVNNGDPDLEGLLDNFDLLPIAEEELTTERLMNGAGRADEPALLLMNDEGVSGAFEGFETASVKLETGEGVSAAINPIVSRVASMLAAGERTARECPTLVMHATHREEDDDDLQPVGFPRPGARISLHASLHEPFGEEGEAEWSCEFEGKVEAATGLHEVVGTVEPAGPVPPSLQGRWQVELFREREIWILRSMSR